MWTRLKTQIILVFKFYPFIYLFSQIILKSGPAVPEILRESEEGEAVCAGARDQPKLPLNQTGGARGVAALAKQRKDIPDRCKHPGMVTAQGADRAE